VRDSSGSLKFGSFLPSGRAFAQSKIHEEISSFIGGGTGWPYASAAPVRAGSGFDRIRGSGGPRGARGCRKLLGTAVALLQDRSRVLASRQKYERVHHVRVLSRFACKGQRRILLKSQADRIVARDNSDFSGCSQIADLARLPS
jgi:hypothetical protein